MIQLLFKATESFKLILEDALYVSFTIYELISSNHDQPNTEYKVGQTTVLSSNWILHEVVELDIHSL